jgi:hypothetical protein
MKHDRGRGLRKSWGDVASRTVKTLAKPVSSHNRGQRVDRTPVLAASGRMMAKFLSKCFRRRRAMATRTAFSSTPPVGMRSSLGKHRIEVIGTDETEMQIDVEGTEVLVECRGG